MVCVKSFVNIFKYKIKTFLKNNPGYITIPISMSLYFQYFQFNNFIIVNNNFLFNFINNYNLFNKQKNKIIIKAEHTIVSFKIHEQN